MEFLGKLKGARIMPQSSKSFNGDDCLPVVERIVYSATILFLQCKKWLNGGCGICRNEINVHDLISSCFPLNINKSSGTM